MVQPPIGIAEKCPADSVSPLSGQQCKTFEVQRLLLVQSYFKMLYASCWLQVPSFDNATAMSLIAQELGQPWHELYADLSPRPIAAASLGQVKLFLLSVRGAVVRNASSVMLHLWPYDLTCMAHLLPCCFSCM